MPSLPKSVDSESSAEVSDEQIKTSTLCGVHRENPAINYSSDSIEEMNSEEMISHLSSMQNAGEPFEKILTFYLDKRNISTEQTKLWLKTFDKFRSARSLSNLPTDVETSASTEARELDLSRFYEKLCSETSWDIDEPIVEAKPRRRKFQVFLPDTSSDSDCEIENSPFRRLRSSPMRRKQSWKEYKKMRDLEVFMTRRTDNVQVKKLVKMTVKQIWRKKKNENIKNKENTKIEISKIEVADMLYEVTDHMAKKYLPKIRRLAKHIDPGSKAPVSECESGSYDSQDEFYPHKEDKRSLLPKMAMSVDPDILLNEGLVRTLIIALPFCADYTDNDQLQEFINILKETEQMKDKIIPTKLTLRGVPKVDKDSPEKEVKPVKGLLVACQAQVEPSPSQDTLAGLEEIEESKATSHEGADESDTESSVSCSADIRERLKRNMLKSIGSEESSSILGLEDITTDSGEVLEDKVESVPEVKVLGETPNPTKECEPPEIIPDEPQAVNLFDLVTLPLSNVGGMHKRQSSPLPDESPSKKSSK